MSEQSGTIDRRSLLKLLGATGASAVVTSCGSLDGSVSAEGLTGGKFDKSITLATAGPGGNQNWQPGDAVKFLPPPEIPTRGKASDVAGRPAQGEAAASLRVDADQPHVGNDDEGPVPRGQGRSLRRVPHLRRRRSDGRRRHRRAERRRLHRQHPSRPRPSDCQGRRSQQDVGRDLLQGDRLQQGLRRLDAHHRHVQGHHGHERHRRRQLLHGGGRGAARAWCAAPSRCRSRSSATARPARRTTSAPSAAAPTSRSRASSSTRTIFQYMGVPMAITVADQVHLRVHQGARHPAPRRRRQRRVGGVRRDAGSRRMGAGRQGPEHDRRHHLPLVRPLRLRRRQGRPGRRDGPALSHRRRGAAVDVARSDSALQEVAAGEGHGHRGRAREDRRRHAGGRRRVGRVRAQERRSRIRRPAC